MIACTFIAVACIGVIGCDNSPAKIQALARINGEAITVRHLQAAHLNESGNAADGALLETIIDRQLLQGEALRMQLDRNPNVRMAIEAAQARILADAYLDHKIVQEGKPTQLELDEYFQKHPEQFSQRKIVDLTLLVTGSGDAQLKEAVDSAQSLDDVAAWLEGRNRSYMRNRLSRTSGELPAEILSRLRDADSQRPFTMSDGANILVVEINRISASPLTKEEALPRIERELTERRRQELNRAEVARLRSFAKLEYLNRPTSRIAGKEPLTHEAGHAASEVR
ncbi:MAG: peptidyl-prolyl cis-trans isomerase, EpsD family [Burkholderiales bacterium]|nr:peptidyl-prolyl cis-trans isomerase, EpsD family [Burkholderiales bacterium]